MLRLIELILVFIISVITFFYFYYLYCFNYWRKRGVPIASPKFPFGDLGLAGLGKQSIFYRLVELYRYFKSHGHSYGGIFFFNGPIFFPIDPEIVKRVLITDFDHFVDRGMFIDKENFPLSSHILTMQGDEWRNVRARFTPTFTSGKMKSMFNILLNNSENFVKVLKEFNGKVVDMKKYCTRFTTDIIGSCAFGIDCNSLRHPDTEFVRMVERIFVHSNWELLKVAFEEGLQNPGNLLKITHSDRKVEKFFTKVVRETIDYRDKNGVVRDDFLNILMEMRKSYGITFNEIVAQSFLFFTAGFETSSSTMSFCLHELAYNKDLQEQLRHEIHQGLGRDSSKYTYDQLLKLPLLDRVVKETLRMYPPASMLNRVCVKPYQIPGTESVIEIGTPVIISSLALQRDPDFWPDPLKFDPDRFNGDTKIVACTYLPFGEGPRNCIGLRFGMMQTKLGLAALLNNYRFSPSDLTPRDLPIDPSTTTISLSVKGGIHLRVEEV